MASDVTQEVYHHACGTTLATTVVGVLPGDIIKAKDIRLLDGTEPKPGDRIVCPNCGPIGDGVASRSTYQNRRSGETAE